MSLYRADFTMTNNDRKKIKVPTGAYKSIMDL